MISPHLPEGLAGGLVTAHGSIPPGLPWWQAWSFDPSLIIPVAIVGWFFWSKRRKAATEVAE